MQCQLLQEANKQHVPGVSSVSSPPLPMRHPSSYYAEQNPRNTSSAKSPPGEYLVGLLEFYVSAQCLLRDLFLALPLLWMGWRFSQSTGSISALQASGCGFLHVLAYLQIILCTTSSASQSNSIWSRKEQPPVSFTLTFPYSTAPMDRSSPDPERPPTRSRQILH